MPDKTKNSLGDLKKFFQAEGEVLSPKEWLEEWNQLSEEEKDWFKSQDLS